MGPLNAALGPVSDEDDAVKKGLIDSYVTARDELDRALASLAPETACGGWSLYEMAAHIAAWEQYSAEQMWLLARGVPEIPVNVDSMNTAVAARARELPPEQSMTTYAASRKAFVDSIERLPAAACRLDAVRNHVGMEVGHCMEHAAELRALKVG
jgi:hypothetical protein